MKIHSLFFLVLTNIVLFSKISNAEIPVLYSVGVSFVFIEGEESVENFGRAESQSKNYDFIIPSADFEVGVKFNHHFPFFFYLGQNAGFFRVNDMSFLNFTSKIGFVPEIFTSIEANPFVEIGFSNLRKNAKDGFRYVPGLFFSTGFNFNFDCFYMKINYNKTVYKYEFNNTVLNGKETVFKGSGIGLSFFKNIKNR